MKRLTLAAALAVMTFASSAADAQLLNANVNHNKVNVHINRLNVRAKVPVHARVGARANVRTKLPVRANVHAKAPVRANVHAKAPVRANATAGGRAHGAKPMQRHRQG